MIKIGDKVKIFDNGLIGEVSDVNEAEGYCYVDVDDVQLKLSGIKPELAGCSFSRKISEVKKLGQ